MLPGELCTSKEGIKAENYICDSDMDQGQFTARLIAVGA